MRNIFLIICTLVTLTSTFKVLPTTTAKSLVISSTTESNKESKNIEEEKHEDTSPQIYDMDIRSNISNRFAKTLITSKVQNPAATAKETTFSVVLPEKAFISEFIMEIDGKSYRAYVKEKEEAKKDYDRAVKSGQGAAHVAVSARDSNRFTVSLNIEPNSKAVFLLTYEELLQRQNGQYELVLNINTGRIIKDLNVEVHINESRPLKFVKTPPLRSGNEISKNDDEKLSPASEFEITSSTSSVVKFSPDEIKQKQYAQLLGGKENDGMSGQFVVQYDVERDPQGGELLLSDGYFVHFFAPSDLKLLPKRVVFVLDVSGSMMGTKMKQLKAAMKHILPDLKGDNFFDIVTFESTATVLDIPGEKLGSTFDAYSGGKSNFTNPFPTLSEIQFPPSAEATEENINKALKAVDKLRDLGGTNIIAGLELGLNLIRTAHMRGGDKYQPIIIFLTDGSPNVGMSSTQEITNTITKLNKENQNVPIFSLSFGDGADKSFLRKLSLKNNGFTRHIYEAGDAAMQLENFYKIVASPLLANISFKYDSNVKEVTRVNYPIYFHGGELVATGKYDIDKPFNSSVIAICTTGPLILQPIQEKPVGSLERLWAYLNIKEILEKRETVDNKTELTQKALDLALKYSFVTDVSSLVVVKPNETNAVDAEDASKANRGRYMPTQSMGYSGIPGPPSPYFLRFGGSSPRRFLTAPRGGTTTNTYRTLDRNPYHSYTNINIENKLPWLRAEIQSGKIYLGHNETISTHPECAKPELNNLQGKCQLIRDCPEIHVNLTDYTEYLKYSCILENRISGVCCPKKKSVTFQGIKT